MTGGAFSKFISQEYRRLGLVNTLMVVGLLGFSLWFAMYGYGVVPEDADCSLHDQTHSNLVENFAYPWIMNHRFRVKTPSKLALVTVSDRNEPLSVTGNVCESRRFLAALLRQLTDLGASVIAIDQSFSEGSCPEDDKSKEFGKALQTFGVPIVVGEAAHERPDAEAGGDRRDCLVETPPYRFEASLPTGTPASASKVHQGLLRLNTNSMKIPLRWWVFKDDQSALNETAATVPREGFALVVAKQAKPDIETSPKLKPFLDGDVHPYATFARSLSTSTWSAMDVLCNGRDELMKEHPVWGQCREVAHRVFERSEGEKFFSDFAGKIVVVGAHIDSDKKEFAGNKQYGVDLHVNYIESLLDGSYVAPAPLGLDVGFIAVFLLFSVGPGLLEARHLVPRGWKSKEFLWQVQCVTLTILACMAYGLLIWRGWFFQYFLLACYPILLGLVPGGVILKLTSIHKRRRLPRRQHV